MADIKHGLEVLQNNVKIAPSKAGVYRMISKSGEVLYVGKAKNIKNRIVAYTHFDKLPTRLKRMVAQVDTMEFIIVENEAKALLMENELIKQFSPRFNILLKDDKSFPLLMIDFNEDYPALRKFRGKKNDKCKYFGPFANVTDVNQTLDFVQKAFMLRTCRNSVFYNRQRPCLLYQIKRCSAPCVGKVSREDYQKAVEDTICFLEGKSTGIIEELTQKMQQASENTDYEQAIILRDRIKAISSVLGGLNVEYADIKSADILGVAEKNDMFCIELFIVRNGQNCGNTTYFPKHTQDALKEEILEAFISEFYADNIVPKEIYVPFITDDMSFLEIALNTKILTFSRGNKAKLIKRAQDNALAALERKIALNSSIKSNLIELQQVFGLPDIPKRIEIYDNSHIQGAYAIGAMVVANQEGFDKKSYRTFNIKNTEITGDDFAMMKEVLKRRFDKLNEQNKPDVILLDGGLGQLNAVYESLKDYDLEGINIIAISKGVDRNAGREFYHMKSKESFSLEYRSGLAFYMQTLRDEAHRFAIGTHRKKRAKSVFKSRLDEIDGIGAKRKRDLLTYFGSADDVAGAGVEDLQKVKGISKKTAEKIYNYFHK
ncbi:MAG: excinuclease ABC subunit UvrC [Alphaproteobacteria bacterium]|nr:excinuclease ABC subunit UvrC [Alphaproteobacteria bacterium]